MLHQRVTRCILIWLVGIMKLHSVCLQGTGGLSGEHPESLQPAGLNFIHPIFPVWPGLRLKPDGPDFWQPWMHVVVNFRVASSNHGIARLGHYWSSGDCNLLLAIAIACFTIRLSNNGRGPGRGVHNSIHRNRFLVSFDQSLSVARGREL
jgi:hypothetical protein